MNGKGLCPMTFSVPANGFNKRCIKAECELWVPLVEVERRGHTYQSGGHCGLMGRES